MVDRTPDITLAAERAARLIADADAIVIGAGAGMGVDSGLPDFRGRKGFWQAYPALARARIEFERIASPAAMCRDAHLAWGFYGHRLQLYRDVMPHDGYALLRSWADLKPHGGFVFTSNVDGHFQKAGFSPQRVHECHGTIHRLQCLEHCVDEVWEAESRLPGDLSPSIDTDACRWLGDLPACPRCGGVIRPNICMFNVFDWIGHRYAMRRDDLEDWLVRTERPVVIELGAGVHIPTVRHFSQLAQRFCGARLVRINPREWAVSAKEDVAMPCGALAGLRAIEAALVSHRPPP